MRRFAKLSLFCLAAGASACGSLDLAEPTEDLPYAGVRFINAVPDSAGAFGLDLRFVDIFENNAHFRIAFRNGVTNNISTGIQYKGAREGSRRFRVFLDDTVQAIASTVVRDTVVLLVRDSNYTAMMWGNGRSATTAPDAMRLTFWNENVSAPAAGKVKLRVINTTSTAIDVWTFPTGSAVPATPTWAAVAPYTRSAYVEVDSTQYSYQVRNAGVGTNLFANTNAPTGVVATCGGNTPTATNPSGCLPLQKVDVEPIPGTRVAGSAVSAIVFPRSTAGSRAPQAAAFTVPAISYMWDKRPPRTVCEPYC